MTWDKAKGEADKLGGYLATITTAEESAFLQAHGLNASGGYVVTGAQQDPARPEPDGGWAWVTGEPWAFTNWAPGEPNNLYGNEACLIMDYYYGWHDAMCYDPVPSGFLVEVDSR